MYKLKLKLNSGETKEKSFKEIYKLAWFLFDITEDVKLQEYTDQSCKFIAWDGVSLDGANKKAYHLFDNHKEFINFCMDKYGNDIPGQAALTINGKQNSYLKKFLFRPDTTSQLWRGALQKFPDEKYHKTIKRMEKYEYDLKHHPENFRTL